MRNGISSRSSTKESGKADSGLASTKGETNYIVHERWLLRTEVVVGRAVGADLGFEIVAQCQTASGEADRRKQAAAECWSFFVDKVKPYSFAASHGLRPADQLLHVNGVPVLDHLKKDGFLQEQSAATRGASGTPASKTSSGYSDFVSQLLQRTRPLQLVFHQFSLSREERRRRTRQLGLKSKFGLNIHEQASGSSPVQLQAANFRKPFYVLKGSGEPRKSLPVLGTASPPGVEQAEISLATGKRQTKTSVPSLRNRKISASFHTRSRFSVSRQSAANTSPVFLQDAPRSSGEARKDHVVAVKSPSTASESADVFALVSFEPKQREILVTAGPAEAVGRDEADVTTPTSNNGELLDAPTKLPSPRASCERSEGPQMVPETVEDYFQLSQFVPYCDLLQVRDSSTVDVPEKLQRPPQVEPENHDCTATSALQVLHSACLREKDHRFVQDEIDASSLHSSCVESSSLCLQENIAGLHTEKRETEKAGNSNPDENTSSPLQDKTEPSSPKPFLFYPDSAGEREDGAKEAESYDFLGMLESIFFKGSEILNPAIDEVVKPRQGGAQETVPPPPRDIAELQASDGTGSSEILRKNPSPDAERSRASGNFYSNYEAPQEHASTSSGQPEFSDGKVETTDSVDLANTSTSTTRRCKRKRARKSKVAENVKSVTSDLVAAASEPHYEVFGLEARDLYDQKSPRIFPATRPAMPMREVLCVSGSRSSPIASSACASAVLVPHETTVVTGRDLHADKVTTRLRAVQAEPEGEAVPFPYEDESIWKIPTPSPAQPPSFSPPPPRISETAIFFSPQPTSRAKANTRRAPPRDYAARSHEPTEEAPNKDAVEAEAPSRLQFTPSVTELLAGPQCEDRGNSTGNLDASSILVDVDRGCGDQEFLQEDVNYKTRTRDIHQPQYEDDWTCSMAEFCPIPATEVLASTPSFCADTATVALAKWIRDEESSNSSKDQHPAEPDEKDKNSFVVENTSHTAIPLATSSTSTAVHENRVHHETAATMETNPHRHAKGKTHEEVQGNRPTSGRQAEVPPASRELLEDDRKASFSRWSSVVTDFLTNYTSIAAGAAPATLHQASGLASTSTAHINCTSTGVRSNTDEMQAKPITQTNPRGREVPGSPADEKTIVVERGNLSKGAVNYAKLEQNKIEREQLLRVRRIEAADRRRAAAEIRLQNMEEKRARVKKQLGATRSRSEQRIAGMKLTKYAEQLAEAKKNYASSSSKATQGTSNREHGQKWEITGEDAESAVSFSTPAKIMGSIEDAKKVDEHSTSKSDFFATPEVRAVDTLEDQEAQRTTSSHTRSFRGGRNSTSWLDQQKETNSYCSIDEVSSSDLDVRPRTDKSTSRTILPISPATILPTPRSSEMQTRFHSTTERHCGSRELPEDQRSRRQLSPEVKFQGVFERVARNRKKMDTSPERYDAVEMERKIRARLQTKFRRRQHWSRKNHAPGSLLSSKSSTSSSPLSGLSLSPGELRRLAQVSPGKLERMLDKSGGLPPELALVLAGVGKIRKHELDMANHDEDDFILQRGHRNDDHDTEKRTLPSVLCDLAEVEPQRRQVLRGEHPGTDAQRKKHRAELSPLHFSIQLWSDDEDEGGDVESRKEEVSLD
ncbi:unnamed protein product [Amoebophrya sp. A120]|nr:unnamed protein product [Amoebophrya sp. A120]|eukprot:GSA120T00001620001.1